MGSFCKEQKEREMKKYKLKCGARVGALRVSSKAIVMLEPEGIFVDPGPFRMVRHNQQALKVRKVGRTWQDTGEIRTFVRSKATIVAYQ